MSCCTPNDHEAIDRNKEAEKLLEKEKKKRNRIITCLLLGTGESGKSTILKQMKILHKDGFSEDERRWHRPVIFMNILESLGILIDQVSRRNLTYENTANAVYAIDVKDSFSMYEPVFEISDTIWQKIQSLTADSVILKLTDEPDGFYLPTSTKYFFQNLSRISNPDWLPSNDDMLRSRKPTQGVNEVDFPIQNTLSTLRLVDVGGQKSERRKWIHLFEKVPTIIFCAALSDYDQMLVEDPTKNRMEDSIEVFGAIINSKWFSYSSVVILFNKQDVFFEKIGRVSISKFFPDFKDEKSTEKALHFITNRYKKQNKANLHVFPHITSATDTKSFKAVLNGVISSMLQVNPT